MVIVHSDRPRRWAALAAFAALLLAAAPAWGQGAVPIRGKVKMEDGSPPPKPATIEQTCQGEAPIDVATTDKNGEYAWLAAGSEGLCAWRAVMDEYASAATNQLAMFMGAFVLHRGAIVPRAARPQWDQAVQSTQAGKWSEAEGELRAILAKYPDSTPVWTALGVVLANQGKPADARGAFERALEINPEYVPAYHRLAALEMDAGDWQAAAKTVAAGIRADETSSAPVLYLDLAQIRQRLKQEGAEAAARKAIQLDRNHEIPQAELVLASMLESGGDTASAAEHMRRYLQLRPNAPDAASVRARVQQLEQSNAAPAVPVPATESAEPLPDGAALVAVPGGLKALAAIEELSGIAEPGARIVLSVEREHP